MDIETVTEVVIIPAIAYSIPAYQIAIILYMLFQIVHNVYGHHGFGVMPKTGKHL